MSRVLAQVDHLEVIYDVLNDISENLLKDCKRIIYKLLKDSKDDETNFDGRSDHHKLSFLNILLELYKKGYSSNTKNTSRLSVKPVLEKLNIILDNQIEDSVFSESQLKDTISILNFLFKIAFLHKSEEDFQELAVFYNQNLEMISTMGYSNTGLLGVRLKILCALCDSASYLKSECVMSGFYERINKFKSINKLDECKLFANLVIQSSNEIAVQLLLAVIPAYIKCFEAADVVIIIWDKLSYSMTIRKTDDSYSRMLLVMCYLIDLCLISNKKELLVILEDVNYWVLIQYGLVQKESLMKKQGMYLFKRSLEFLVSSEENLTTHARRKSCGKTHQITMRWDCDSKSKLSSIYEEIIVVLEFLDEQQIHIIKPIFQMVDKLVDKILGISDNGQIISFSWVILIYQKALMHESAQVIRWGLCGLLKLPDIVLSDDSMIETITDFMVPSLSNTSLYYNDGLALSQELANFFNRVSHLKSSQLFFSLFIKKLCSLVWSPESLYFVTHALAGSSKMAVWQESELLCVKEFVCEAFKTHNKLIRTGTQCELLNSIMLLTDERKVSLDCIVILLTSFSTSTSGRKFFPGSLQIGSQMWKKIVEWLRESYSEQDAKKCLEDCEKNNHSSRAEALMIILFFDAYSNKTERSECFVANRLSEIFSHFDCIEWRPYCSLAERNYDLSVICQILDESVNGDIVQTGLLKMIFPFCTGISLYIYLRCKEVSCLDYYICRFYIEAFECVLKALKLFPNHPEDFVKTFDSQIVKGLKVDKRSKKQSIMLYCRVGLLKTFFSVFPDQIKSEFLFFYFDGFLNKPLEKDASFSRMDRESVVAVWGKMNSEYLGGKWEILEKLVRMEVIVVDFGNHEKGPSRICGAKLIKSCLRALTIVGYEVLCPIMSIFGNNLFKLDDDSGIVKVVNLVWEIITERRKTDKFKLIIKKFMEILFRKELMTRGPVIQDTLFKYVDLLFADSSLVVVHTFVKHIHQMGMNLNAVPVFSHILAKALMFGPVMKKDERLTVHVSSLIESFGFFTVGEYYRSNEIRARAVQMILSLDGNCPSSRAFAEVMFETLLKEESQINKNRIRYFGDSHVHRVKHRMMQALLLLEPLLSCNKNVAEKLSKWLYKSLMSENPQPSVKYQQEWLLIRVLMKWDDLLNNFWHFFDDPVEKTTKGLCSLIAISYHLCKLICDERQTSWMDQAIPTILPFCMDQHFEVRLYAQVIVEKLYELAKSRGLESVIDKYRMINDCVLKSIQRGCKGNAGKNCDKLKEDFYLNVFHPLEHYSLQTIYQDLPRLANMGSDEWISPEVFKRCGVNPDQIHIPIENPTRELEDIDEVKWSVKGFGQRAEEGSIEEEPGNYQKKMIPLKPLAPDLEEGFSCTKSSRSDHIEKKDGLVVVASLIDRIPNLGGLARTCEIFGASEFVIGSLKYVKDKQFTSLSVTAEKWVTVKEVKAQDLLNYILGMKQNGYAVIGAEQALYSQPLSSVKFPKQSLLLLGNEKEGIPPNLLPLLDVCVEIPQVGIIRSLNVHVTGALFIWEYAKQNNFS